MMIQDNGVKKLLEGLNPHKASGQDEISSCFLKEMIPNISPALTLLFQASYDQVTVPTDWKGAFVTPLFKKGLKLQSCFSDLNLFQGHGAHNPQPSHEVP